MRLPNLSASKGFAPAQFILGRLLYKGEVIPKDTKKAIEDLKITWPQILNAQNTPSELYGFNGIPHIILFGPDGTIVARDLRGDALKAKVKEMMQ